MKIERLTTAETATGVVTRTDDVLDTSLPDAMHANIWGFDAIPDLPLSPEQLLGDYVDMGLFGPPHSVRVDVLILPPETGEKPADLGETVGKLNLGTGGGMIPHESGFGMHRTDTIDLLMVLEGETNVAYPSEDGSEFEVTIKAGDFITHNGTFHRWHNRSGSTCTLLCVVIATNRTGAAAA
jgi:hypothetical protein